MDGGPHKILRPNLNRGKAWPPLPFAGIFAAAATGSAAGLFLGGPWLSAGVALFCLAAVFILGDRAAYAAMVAGTALAFAAMGSFRGTSSPAARFADRLVVPVALDVEGRVVSVPSARGENRWSLDLEGTRWGRFGSFPMRVAADWRGPAPEIGDLVRISGSLEPLERPRNPGEFDPGPWLARRGIFCKLVASSPQACAIAAKGSRLAMPSIASRAAAWIERTVTAGLDPSSPEAALIVGMTVGQTRGLDPALEDDFRATGTFHLFSVSGLHVGMVALIGWLILGSLRIPRKAVAAILIPALFFYALATGWKPASVRAATMAGFVLVGLLVGRKANVANSLLAAGFAILLANPAEIGNPGFQFSFATVLALAFSADIAGRLFARPMEVDPFLPRQLYGPPEKIRGWLARKLSPALAVSTVAWAASTGLVFWYFHMFSLVAIPANLVCVPLAFCSMALSAASVVSGALWFPLAAVFNNANWAAAAALIATVKFFASLPGAYFYVPPPENDPPAARLTVLDMGAGAAVLAERAGSSSLLDCGPSFRFSGTLLPFLRLRGIARPDSLVVTHGDATHIGAAEKLSSVAPPRQIFEACSEDRSPTRRKLRSAGVRQISAGDSLPLLGGVDANVIFPPPDWKPRTADDGALVMAFTLAGWRVLSISDAGPATERWLLENARAKIACDVLVKGQHASGTAADPEFLRAARPKIAVLASADFPPGTRVPNDTLRVLRESGCAIFLGLEDGAVTLDFRPETVSVRAFFSGKEAAFLRRQGHQETGR